jgi:hypothetical protein
MTPTITPDMIDGVVITLRQAFTTAEGVPDKVKDTGKAFLEALDEYSEQLKTANNGK